MSPTSAAEPSPLARAAAIQACADGALTIRAAVEFSGISRTVLYELMAEGRLSPIRIGRRVLLPRAELVEILAAGMALKEVKDRNGA